MDEKEYFARESTEKLRKLHHEQVKHLTKAQREELKALHAHRCPNCGMQMQKLPAVQDVTLWRCFECGGTFIDLPNAEKLHGASKRQEHAIVNAVISWFKHEDHK